MGASPRTPSLGYENGIMRKEGACGGHIMGEHALSGKLTFSTACRDDRLLHPIIRV